MGHTPPSVGEVCWLTLRKDEASGEAIGSEDA
jgi:hypothetical protein